jgi:predicted permease
VVVRSLWQDIQYGLRVLGKNPGFTLIAVLTLALGIGANTAIFSILHQVLLRSLPVRNPQELVLLKSPGPKTGHIWSDGDDSEIFSYPLYKGISQNTSVFNGVIARYQFPASFSDHGQTDRASAELVSGNYFETLGIRPALGRVLTPGDDLTQGAHPVVVLSYGYWTNHFGGDPSVLNRTVLINNTEMTIVGVAQSGFTGVQVGQTPDLFVPLMMKGQMTPLRNGLDDWNDHWLAVLARLKSGVSRQQAEAGIASEYRSLMEQQIAHIKNIDAKGRDAYLAKKIVLSDGSQGRTTFQRDSGPAIVALFAMVALVLLIACTNVANLLLAQGAARQREFTIRTAMGATRFRIVRQLIVESLLCAVAGGGLGLVLGIWLMNLLTRAVVNETGILGLVAQVDSPILLFALGVTLLSGLLFGLIPAWRVARATLTQTLKDQATNISAGPGHVRFRKILVAGQVAFTLLLLTGASLFMRTLWNLRNQNLGIATDNLISFSVQPQLNGYKAERNVALLDQIRQRLAAIPGVRSVASSQIAVLTGTDMGTNVTVEGRPSLEGDERHVDFDGISPSYFSTLQVPMLSGREFRESDSATSPKVAVINETMAKKFFSGRNPLGAHFALGGGNGVKPDIEIVGVVKDWKQEHVRAPDRSYFFLPYSQMPSLFSMTFYSRTEQDPLRVANDLRAAVKEQDANLPIYDLKTVARVVDEDLFAERMVAGLSGAFGGLAAILAALGIYGVLAYLVLQRTREIGIRMALGAGTSNVRALVYREVGVMVAAGSVVGLPIAYVLARYTESMLFGVKAGYLPIYLVSLGIICAVALAACYIPSRRATRIDPIVALRYE